MAARISAPSCGSPSSWERRCKEKREFHTIVIRSTVQPGTVEEKIGPILERASGKKSGVDFGLCFQPEFLREGSSIRDYDHPPYTIVGGNCEAAVNVVRELFQHLDARFLVTNIRVAEALKMACNAFHAHEDHLRQRDRPGVAGAGHRFARGHAPGLRGSAAEHFSRLSQARVSPSAAHACPRICAR